MAALGNHAGRCGSRYALPTGGFRAAEFHWPLSSDEFKEQTDAARPVPALPSVLSDVATALKIGRSGQGTVEISDIGYHDMTHAGCNGSTYKADSPLDELARRLNLLPVASCWRARQADSKERAVF